MSTQEHHAHTERLVDWLEQKRRQAGLTQDQVARMGGISHSYYSKIVSSWRLSEEQEEKRKRYVSAPDPKILEGILTGMKEKLGDKAVEEGFALLCPPTQKAKTGDEDLVRLLLRVQRLSPEKRKTVLELIDHLD
jgi:transcriptional regulator with XRE-family HTH domain